MKIEIRCWNVKYKKMVSSEQMMKDERLSLLSNGTFINAKGHIFAKDILFPMLYTGIKDVNGKKIFEGDILWCESESLKGDVWWEDTGFVTDCYGNGTESLRDSELIEVIGNVYENPEMVEGLIRI